MIYLRLTIPQDADLILSWENDPKNKAFSDHDGSFTNEDISKFIEELNKSEFGEQQRYMICDSEVQVPLGAVDLFDVDRVNASAGVGILIAEASQRQRGVATKSLLLLEEKCMDFGVDTLKATVHSWNEPSLKLFKKAGYTLIGENEELINFKKCLKR